VDFIDKGGEKWVTIDDVAAHFTIAIPTVRLWVRQNKITPASYLKVGNTYRFKLGKVEQDLLAFDERDPKQATTNEDDALVVLDFSDDEESNDE
jgi:hypothetical protein